jgi:signal transduction histidine kinase
MTLPPLTGGRLLTDVRLPGAHLLLFAALATGGAAFDGQAAGPEPALPSAVQDVDTDGQIGDEAFEAAQRTYATADDPVTRLRALFTISNLQRRRGDIQDGIASANEGLDEARRLGDIRLQIDFLYLLGRLHWNLSDYPRSLENHFAELKLAEQLGDAGILARTHGGLGLTFFRYGRSDDALLQFETGLGYAVRAGDERMRASLLNSLGNYHLAQQDFVRATSIHEQALRIREGFGNRRAIAESLTNLGLSALGLGDTDKSLAYLERALAMFESLRYRRYIANTHRRIATVLRQAGRLDEALGHLRTAEEIGVPLQSAEFDADLYREFALTHEARGEFALALAAERKLAASNEEMRNEMDRRTIAELGARYRAEQRELEITLLRREQELQQAEIRRRRTQTITLGLGLVAGVGLLGIIVFVQLQRLRAERRLRTAHEHARSQAESADRLKTRLLQMAAHDLKVPLTALHAAAGRIRESADTGPEARRLAGGILSDTARMRNLVRDFLDAAAHEEGNLQLHLSPVDLPALVRTAVARLQPVATQKEQRLQCDDSTILPAVQADPDRLHQVFDNLIGNALKFTPPGGEIEVRFGRAGQWAFAEVRDSGPGFGPEEFARIFSPGEPLAAKPTGEEDSTGMGLFIARELLTLQGGRLEVQSKPGSGAIFRVLLPVVPPPAA